jgi:arsenate reductase-like glutaredoxin family protein
VTCKRASGFLEEHQIEVVETVSANKKLKCDDAISMVRQARRLIAAKGKKVTRFDLSSDHPSDDEIAKLMLGPTGNLRAPTMRVGETILVGYNEEVFNSELG